MTKERLVEDLRRIAMEINEYADGLIQNADSLRNFSIIINLNTDGTDLSSYEVSSEFSK